ncbi:MAG TPA: GNAT family N-acetyltransferase [Prolixibacteraceae bacterium]|nr:GNAT family N-acetyltransferase [Prolixibacteraceae bacterium]
MNLKLKFDTSNINWDLVTEILKSVGMAYHTSDLNKLAFHNSYAVVFAFDDEKMVGFGRAISDGAYQAAIYDVAVIPDYQGKGIGKTIIDCIIQKCPNCNFILYAAPGKDLFYEKCNFRRMKTGMALFTDIERMKLRGFTE